MDRSAIAADDSTEAPFLGRETVLVVEDDETVGQAICHVLESHGYRVLLASNAREALRTAMLSLPVSIKVVVADVIMPKVNGREIADWLKAVAPGVKILMTSGHPGEIHAHRMGERPGEIFIPKPFSPDALAQAVRNLLDS